MFFYSVCEERKKKKNVTKSITNVIVYLACRGHPSHVINLISIDVRIASIVSSHCFLKANCRHFFVIHNNSDEAIAAYLEASGESLTELSLNNFIKVWTALN